MRSALPSEVPGAVSLPAESTSSGSRSKLFVPPVRSVLRPDCGGIGEPDSLHPMHVAGTHAGDRYRDFDSQVAQRGENDRPGVQRRIRIADIGPVRRDSIVVSVGSEPLATVNGVPDWKVVMPAIDQPPRAYFHQPERGPGIAHNRRWSAGARGQSRSVRDRASALPAIQGRKSDSPPGLLEAADDRRLAGAIDVTLTTYRTPTVGIHG